MTQLEDARVPGKFLAHPGRKTPPLKTGSGCCCVNLLCRKPTAPLGTHLKQPRVVKLIGPPAPVLMSHGETGCTQTNAGYIFFMTSKPQKRN